MSRRKCKSVGKWLDSTDYVDHIAGMDVGLFIQHSARKGWGQRPSLPWVPSMVLNNGIGICFGIGVCLLSLAEMHRPCAMVSLCDLPGAQSTALSRSSAGATGIVDYTNYDDMKYAIRKLDDSEFQNAFTRAIVRSPKAKSARQSPAKSHSRSASRSRSGSKPRSLSSRIQVTFVNPTFSLELDSIYYYYMGGTHYVSTR
ncbi:hypothetical protein CsSME_00047320 [Camellia sinensis var. sinensis]